MPSSSSSVPQVRVVVPAKNESLTIEAALDALRRQVDCDDHPLNPTRYDVTVLANNCADDTADVVRRYATQFPDMQLRVREETFPPQRANIGNARRTLFDDACERFELAGVDGIVASTDADTSVSPDWIARMLAEFANGAQAVGGRIVISPAGLQSLGPILRAMHLRDTGYRILLANLAALVDPQSWDPFPRHHQHFGASLAVRVSTYRRAGGIPTVVTLEDMAFYSQLLGIDARVRHSPRVRVMTSARRDGRVQTGLSTQLVEWSMAAVAGLPRTEEPAARSLKRMELIRERRCAWQQNRSLDGFSTFGCYLKSVEDEIEGKVQQTVPFRPVLLEQVIQDLRKAVGRRSNRSSR